MSKIATSKAAQTRGVAKAELLYTRGDYRLYSMPGRSHQIRIYNPSTKQNDRMSAGTTDLEEAKAKLDRLYVGTGFCKHCGQAVAKDAGEDADSIVRIIDDYLVGPASTKTSSGSIKDRLNHVKRYIGDKPVRIGHINEDWITAFRAWLKAEPYYRGKSGTAKKRKPSTIEGSVIQLKAAIRHAGKVADFKPKQPGSVVTPVDFRPDVPLMAAMFRYALANERRVNLLYYLRLSVATWGRPEAVLEADLTPEAQQWVSDAKVFRLNPVTREQNHKYRADVPVGPLVAAWLDSLPAKPVLPAGLSNATWARMMAEIKPGLPAYAGGLKCIRRGMAKLGLQKLGRANWEQGKFMGGWSRPNSMADVYSGYDIYTLHDEDMMGKAVRATNEIIAEIEALVPGAFNHHVTMLQHNHSTRAKNVVAMRG